MEATDGRAEGPEPSPQPPQPTLTVAAVARRLGVAPPTLRTWDRRYGLGPSAHTAGAHRRYSPADVARLMVMRRLTLQGVAPADAAALALAADGADGDRLASITSLDGRRADEQDEPAVEEPRPAEPADRYVDRYDGRPARREPSVDADFDVDPDSEDVSDPFADSDLLSARRAEIADLIDAELGLGDPLGTQDSPWRDEPGGVEIETPWLGVLRQQGRTGPAGGGRVIALPDGSPPARGLARAAMSLDTQQTARLLRESLRRSGVVTTWEGLAVPVLQALGERTRATGDGIDVEHALTEVLLGVLRGVVHSLRQPRNTAPVLLSCAEDDYHSLPLHVLAAALAEREVGTRMLGTGLPPHALAAAVRRSGPSGVVIYAQIPGADAGWVDELRRQRPAPRVILAGSGWRTETIPPAVRCANSLGEAIDEVMLAVHI